MANGERVRGGRPRPSGGFELFAWLFMRVSGLVLVFLALGHLAIMHLINHIDNIDFQFVAERYATPFWRTYDLLMLVLALMHGCNGLRTVLEDYCRKPALRVAALSTLYVVCFVFGVMGAMIILTFQPSDFVK